MTGFELAIWLIPALGAGALPYATVGHGGAPAEMKPIALALAIAGTKLALI